MKKKKHEIQQIIEDTRKVYTCARIVIEGDRDQKRLMNRNIATNTAHPFSNDKMFIPVPPSLLNQVNEWIR